MKYTAEYIAEWFLARNRQDIIDGSDEQITNLKLQKLLYYAQGCTLALADKPLFEDEIQAWAHGPVVPNIYRKYKSNGSSGIKYEGIFDYDKLDDSTASILEGVYEEFGQFSAWKLRNMTHEETPWIETKRNGVISLDSIKRYFKENYMED